MTAKEVVAALDAAGVAVAVDRHGNPRLVGVTAANRPGLADALAALPTRRANVLKVIRSRAVAGILARAGREGKKVYGYDSEDGRVRENPAAGQVPAEWDRACVEGDSEWTYLPK